MMWFYAFAVDIYSTVQAQYTLAAKDPEAARREAERHLQQHELIEVWSEDRRRSRPAGQKGEFSTELSL
ncbi:hypothetical protein [Bradyrhizobium sp. 76]|jgi:hypothetical protein|uniref:hypothetical protein n=1 Tax=Bradyrhizobium sp. 76 TaxID=2782680 RepID=UPI001FFABEFF|nr:hypothetical protein [Bradyrhizobium sp. 76]MCK1406802.1 hypothetical protein [Bradyrhizobium sp. 76]